MRTALRTRSTPSEQGSGSPASRTPAPVFGLLYRPDEAHDRVSGVPFSRLLSPAVQALEGRSVVLRKPGLGSEFGWSHRDLAKSLLPPRPSQPNSYKGSQEGDLSLVPDPTPWR